MRNTARANPSRWARMSSGRRGSRNPGFRSAKKVNPKLEAAIEEFNRGEYFTAAELFEHAASEVDEARQNFRHRAQPHRSRAPSSLRTRRAPGCDQPVLAGDAYAGSDEAEPRGRRPSRRCLRNYAYTEGFARHRKTGEGMKHRAPNTAERRRAENQAHLNYAPCLTRSTLQASIRECCDCAALVKCRARVVPGDGAVPARCVRRHRARTLRQRHHRRSIFRRPAPRHSVAQHDRTRRHRKGVHHQPGALQSRDPSAGAIAIDAEEIDNCRRHLDAEIAMVRPRIVVLPRCDGVAGLAGRETVFDPTRPQIHEHNSAILYPMYHPGYVIRGAYDARLYTRDFRRLRRHARAALTWRDALAMLSDVDITQEAVRAGLRGANYITNERVETAIFLALALESRCSSRGRPAPEKLKSQRSSRRCWGPS